MVTTANSDAGLGITVSGRDNGLPATMVYLAMCMGLWTLIMMALAAIGGFRPGILLAIGVPLAVIAIARCWRNTRLHLNATPQDWAAAVLLAAATILYAGFPKESILGERDEGIYVQHAMHLALTGGSSIDLEPLGIAGSSQAVAIARGLQEPLPGIYPTTSEYWTFQFSSALPAWLAISKFLGGDWGLLRFNALVCLLNGLVFYLLAKRTLPPRSRVWALVALACYAFNPAQVWISRNTLSEPLSSLFLLSGLLAAYLPIGTMLRRGLIAGALIGMATFVRIDGVVYPLAIAIAWCSGRIIGQRENTDRLLRDMLAGSTLMTVAALAYFQACVPQYFADLRKFVLVACAICAGTVFLAALADRLSRHRRRIPRHAPAILFVFSIAVFTYAMWMRPHLQPYSLIHSDLVPALDGLRDYREATLPNLAGYLGMPMLLFAALGLALFLSRLIPRGMRGAMATIICILLIPTIIYLWNPMVSPDHIWASRRWVPAVIPCVLLLATVGIGSVTRHMPAKVGTIMAWGTALLLASFMLEKQRDTLFMKEDTMLIPQVAAIARFLPNDRPTYLIGMPTLGSALLTAYGKPVLPLALSAGGIQDAATLDIGDQCSQSSPCLLLHPPYVAISDSNATLFAQGAFDRVRRNTSPLAPAHGTRVERTEYRITRISRP